MSTMSEPTRRFETHIHTVEASADGARHTVDYQGSCVAASPRAAAEQGIAEVLETIESATAQEHGLVHGAVVTVTVLDSERPAQPGWTVTICLDAGDDTVH